MRRRTRGMVGKYALANCWSKPAYPTEERALEKAAEAAGDWRKVTSNPYQCRFCGEWHLTTKRGGKR